MRDWTKALRAAAFRGVPFRVDVENAEGARRLSISPVAYAETSVIEDMGREPRIVSLSAYVVGDTADAAALTLSRALDAKGAALLSLPMLGPMRARVQAWRLAREKSRGGYVAFDVTFIEEGLSAVPFGPVPGAGPIADIMSAGAAIMGAALAAAMRGASPSRESGSTRAAERAAARLAEIAPLTTGGDTVSAASSAATEALNEAAAAVAADPAGFAVTLVIGWRRVALDAEPAALFSALPAELAAPGEGAAGLAERAAMVGALSIAAMRRTYAARQDASRAREALRLAADGTLGAIGELGDEAFRWTAEITGEAARSLSRTAANRAPLARVETPISLSSIRAAFALYGDPNRAGEIVERNRVATPAFLPTAFEALTE